MPGCLGCEKECEKVWGFQGPRDSSGRIWASSSCLRSSCSMRRARRPTIAGSLLMERAVPLNKPTAYSRLVGVPRGAECHQGVRPSRAARLYGRRRAPVVSGRPSACHGCAVACIGQPPPPSAPGPVWGGGHGCSPAAAVAGRSPALMGKGRPRVSSRGCAASWLFRATSSGSAYQLSDLSAHGFALRRSIAPQPLCSPLSAFVLVE
jgi:hypothetical protein